MLYDAQNQPIASTVKEETEDFIREIPSQNFPPPTPKPDWFDKELIKIGGYADKGTNKIPQYRIVWGMDPAITQFAMGEMRMKYVAIIDTIETTLGYNVVNTKKDKKYFLNPKEAHRRFFDTKTGLLTRGVNPGEIIVPVTKTEKRSIGTPLWIVEQFVPPEAFGTAIAWNNDRYLINEEDPTQYIDALGEYPDKGAYIHWFDLVDYDENGAVKYKELDDTAIEMIRANHIMNVARKKKLQTTTIESARKERDDKIDAQWQAWDDEITKEMLDIKKNKHSVSGVITEQN